MGLREVERGSWCWYLGVMLGLCIFPVGLGQYSRNLRLKWQAAGVLEPEFEGARRRLASYYGLAQPDMRTVLLVMSCHNSAAQEGLASVDSPRNQIEIVPVPSVALQR